MAQYAKIAAIAVAALGMAIGGVWWMQAPSANSADAALVGRGRVLYGEHCAACHGADLQGEPDWRVRGPDGMLPAPPHDPSGHTWHHTDEQLFGIVKHGMARFAPPEYKTKMPSFVGTLSDSDIQAVLAYIKSRWPVEIRERQPKA